MEQTFKSRVAKEYGIEAAIIIHALYQWIRVNAANERSWIDGRYWVDNTRQALIELFDFMNDRKLLRLMNNLVAKGVLTKAHHNKNQFDRSLWFAFTDEGMAALEKLGYDFARQRRAPIVKEEKPNPFCRKKNTDKSSSPKLNKDNEHQDESGWRGSFETYKNELRQEFILAATDAKWIAERERYHQGIDIVKSVEKAIVDYWATEHAWIEKKKKSTKTINWRNTFNNALTFKNHNVRKENQGQSTATNGPKLDTRWKDEYPE